MAEPWGLEVERWLARNTISSPPPAIEDVAEAKRTGGIRVSVCLPALDEATTIGAICGTIRTELADAGVVDELLVVDSGSTDGTPDIAAAAGAKVHSAAALLPAFAERPGPAGKGDAMWKSLAVATGDVVVWIDSDIRDFDASFVTRLVAPFLADSGVVMTKGFYERPVAGESGGGRVTEIGARPLLRLLYPRLSGVIQPLSGEYALKSDVARELPFVTGYGVDAGLLIDVVHQHGLDALVQVDLGTRVHRNRDLLELGVTSFEVLHSVLTRLHDIGAIDLADAMPDSLAQFDGTDAAARWVTANVVVRPPLAEVHG